ncbi:hypothetical protein [Streptomyces sp. NPDC005805]|uniref:hypothetical protein n=1 Tax=Streptomyces sp. NPDC005805 TaxID=3157068 RepID=UPI0033E3D7A5
MRNPHRGPLRVLTALAMAAGTIGAVAPGAAASGCTPTGLVNSSAWNVRVCGMPDIDQYRSGLVQGGEFYCGPTVVANALYYMDLRGHPFMLPGAVDPMKNDPGNYAKVTNQIKRISNEIGLDAEEGIGVQGITDGLNRMIRGTGHLGMTARYESLALHPFAGHRVATLLGRPGVKSHVMIGAVLRMKAGKVLGRHAVTIVGAQGTLGGTSRITFNDPATLGFVGTGKQSPEMSLTYDLGQFVVNRGTLIKGYDGYNKEQIYLQGVVVID